MMISDEIHHLCMYLVSLALEIIELRVASNQHGHFYKYHFSVLAVFFAIREPLFRNFLLQRDLKQVLQTPWKVLAFLFQISVFLHS